MAGFTYWMGSDKLGRDVYSRLVYGTRVSMAVAYLGAAISFTIGVSWGLVTGYSRPRIDNIMMRIVDIIYAYPTLILIILLQVFLTALAQKDPADMRPLEQLFVNLDQNSGGLFFVFVAIGAVSWLNMARLMRGQVMHYKEQEFVQAAHVVGANDRRIMGRHLLPNAIGPCIVAETLAIPTYIATEAFLSFIGLGVQPPTPSWGSMIADGYGALRTAPWLIFFPALALSLTMLAFNFLGDAIRDTLDPSCATGRLCQGHSLYDLYAFPTYHFADLPVGLLALVAGGGECGSVGGGNGQQQAAACLRFPEQGALGRRDFCGIGDVDAKVARVAAGCA